MNANSSRLVRVALIGVSGYGRIHLQLLRESRARGELTIAAAVVINPEEEAENIAELRAHGSVIYHDYEQMLMAERGQIELCMIPTGIHWHARMTVAALRAGMNVLVEKPLAATLEDVEAVRRAERETGLFVAVGFQDYYEAGTQWLKEQVSAGAIGRLESVRFLGIWPRPRSYYARNNWAGRLQSDGRPVFDSPLNNAFAHFVMLGLYLAGAGRDESAAAVLEDAELFRAHAIETFDTAVVRMKTTEGVRLWLGVSHACQPQFEPEIQLRGTLGTASWHYEKEARVEIRDGATQRHTVGDITQARREMMAAVLQRLRDPEIRVCRPEIARHHTEVIAALHHAQPFVPFAAGLIEWSDQGVPAVRGLCDALQHAYAHGSRLADVGFTASSTPPAN